MTKPSSSRADRALFYDDEPIAAVLYGKERPGPSSTSVFAAGAAAAETVLVELSDGDPDVAIARIGPLMASGVPLPLSACATFVGTFASVIPMCPRPLLPRSAVDHGHVLRALADRTERFGATTVSKRALTLLYRLHEGRGEYGLARSVIGRLLRSARARGDERDAAVLENNYGYEYLLEGRLSEAEPYFRRALDVFERSQKPIEVANVRANLLACRFARSTPDDPVPVGALFEVHRVLRRAGDWRVRKTMRTLAEHCERRGRIMAASWWASRAVAASGRVRTQLREDDARYLEYLKRRDTHGPQA